MSRQDDFQNCCGSDTPASNFYTRLRCPTHSQVWFAKDEVGGVSNEIADEKCGSSTRGGLKNPQPVQGRQSMHEIISFIE
jgi:hypothetical protein